jgi:hypothetical protein
VRLFWKLIVSLLAAMLLFEGMVAAFHLLNLPSNRAVLGGFCLLLCLAVGGVVVFRNLWKRRR